MLWVNLLILGDIILVLLYHIGGLIDYLLHLVLQNLCHVKNDGKVTPLLLSEPCTLGRLERILAIVALLEGFGNPHSEVLDTLLSLLPLGRVH